MRWPTVIYNEEVMREGFGIEDRAIPLEAKVELLEALSRTGLRRITVGAFVSPRFVPQMADFPALLRAFQPEPGVTYLPFIHNAKARALAAEYAPPLTLEAEIFTLFLDICDVHCRRNVNRSIDELVAGWPAAVAQAAGQGVRQGRVGVGSAWGSNFLGGFSQAYRFGFLERQIALMQAAGIEVEEIGLHDSQSWVLPHELEADLLALKRRWPSIRRYHLHLHNARGMAVPALYAALRGLDGNDTLVVDGTLGGIGGGQFGGNGRASGMVPTEDVMHMLDGMGIPTGVDLDKLIDCVWLLERIIGRAGTGHVAAAGPRPAEPASFYDPNIPAVESLGAAKHFRFGRTAYAAEGYSPWKQPIVGPFHATT